MNFWTMVNAAGALVYVATACTGESASREGEVAGAKLDGQGNSVMASIAPHPGPTRPDPTVLLEPPDLMTAAGQETLGVVVSNLGAPVGQALLDEVARSVTLRTWPELAAIETDIVSVADAKGTSDADGFARIRLRARRPLADRWYVLTVDTLPQGIAWPSVSNTYTLDGGARGVRFRVGSELIVNAVRAYEKSEGQQVIYVEFSERVVGDASLVTLSNVSGGCVAAPAASIQTAESEGAEIRLAKPDPAANSYTEVQFTCTHSGEELNVGIDIAPGLRSTSGPEFNLGRPLHLSVSATDWTELPDGGKQFVPSPSSL